MFRPDWSYQRFYYLLIAVISTCLIASANYVLNEWLDAKSDAFHPEKKNRSAVVGNVGIEKVTIFYLILAILGLGLATFVSTGLVLIEAWLLVMGWLYNIPPVRMKDKPYIDVLSESINNPIRLWIGWACVISTSPPPLSLILGYWFGGAFLMNVKRFAERRTLADKSIAALYRKSFGYYTEKNLLAATLFYAIISFFFVGVFSIRYRIEYILITPFLAYLYVIYFNLGMEENSVAQKPEGLYRQKRLISFVLLISILYFLLNFFDLDILNQLFESSIK
jgi:4-hydroxybenzoate polyprenyltransferase